MQIVDCRVSFPVFSQLLSCSPHAFLSLYVPLVSHPSLALQYYSSLLLYTATKIPVMYSFSGKSTASAPILTFMCL